MLEQRADAIVDYDQVALIFCRFWAFSAGAIAGLQRTERIASALHAPGFHAATIGARSAAGMRLKAVNGQAMGS